jgi:hypothetical protein
MKEYEKIPFRLLEYRDPIFDLVPDHTKVVVEVGSRMGWFAWRILKHVPGCVVFCVDVWDRADHDGDGPENFQAWIRNIGNDHFACRAFPVRMSSLKAGELFRMLGIKIDFLFIDANHTEEAVFEDLAMWTPLVRLGGLIAGHDWDSRWGKNVQAAVLKWHGKTPNIGMIFDHNGKKSGVKSYWWLKE